MKGRADLIAAGGLSSGLALFHFAIILAGASALRSFGAPDLASRAEAGSVYPALLLAGVAGLFVVFAFYAFAAAGLAPRPPLLRAGLITIGALYTVDGIQVGPKLVGYWSRKGSVAPREIVADAVFLVIGVLYLRGTARAWPDLAPPRRQTA
jgi:hypothetical protein